ncbi:hypothetical protein ACFQX7_33935 [Luedemannella flava]
MLAHALEDTEAYVSAHAVEELIRQELRRCLALGITHAHEAYVPPGQHARMARLAAAEAPRLSWAIGAAEGLLSPVPGPRFAPGGPYGASSREVKLFLDGATGARSACPPPRSAGWACAPSGRRSPRAIPGRCATRCPAAAGCTTGSCT